MTPDNRSGGVGRGIDDKFGSVERLEEFATWLSRQRGELASVKTYLWG